MMNNPLWEFSLALYGRPDVAAACLEAQDNWGADVNLLLYAAWLARQNLALEAAQWRQLAAGVAQWRQRVVQPLRALRLDWQDLPAAAELREQIKILELTAEQEQQAYIFGWHQRQVLRPAAVDGLGLALVQLLAAPSAQSESDHRHLVRRLGGLLA